MQFQVGQWGLKVSGSQKAYFLLNQDKIGVQGLIISKSTMGQGFDWGANQANIDKFNEFLKIVIANPQKMAELSLSTPIVPKAKSTIDIRYYFLIVLTTLFILVSVYLYYLNGKQRNQSEPITTSENYFFDIEKNKENLVPGKIVIAFEKKYYSNQYRR